MATTTIGSSSEPTLFTDATTEPNYNFHCTGVWKLVAEFPSEQNMHKAGVNREIKLSEVIGIEFKFQITGSDETNINNARKALVSWFKNKSALYISHKNSAGVNMLQWPAYSDQSLGTLRGKIERWEEEPIADYTHDYRVIFVQCT